MKAEGKDVQSRYFDGAPHQLVFMPPWRDDAVKLSAAFFVDRLSR